MSLSAVTVQPAVADWTYFNVSFLTEEAARASHECLVSCDDCILVLRQQHLPAFFASVRSFASDSYHCSVESSSEK